MFAGKPIIGIAGGIGSGKSFVANLFAELGCLVLAADDQVRQAYADPAVRHTLRDWWGDTAFDATGAINRKAIAAIIFADPAQRQRLEALVHPIVARLRDDAMQIAATDPAVLAFVWDVPLLFEVGLNDRCDAIVFVEAPLADRLARVRAPRGWDDAELARRENLQAPLDKKRRMSKYIVQNTADVGFARTQVQAVLSEVLAASAMGAGRTHDPASGPDPVV
ncbi:MAG: dephospho-CoA kinase [Phycisphaerae bacterium]